MRLEGQKSDQWLPGIWDGTVWLQKSLKKYSGVMEMLYLDCGRCYMTEYICQIHQIVYFRRMNLTVSKLYFNKLDSQNIVSLVMVLKE